METSNRVVCGMVLGEASESDEDSDAPTEFTIGNSSSILASTLMSNQKTTKKPPNKHKLKYNTLLHYKLRDSNIALRNDMVAVVEQPVIQATNSLSEAVQMQSKTRASLHEMPRHLHQLSVALVGLQDRLPNISKAKIIPNTKLN